MERMSTIKLEIKAMSRLRTPRDVLILLSLIGLAAYLAYENMKRRTRSINEETYKKDA